MNFMVPVTNVGTLDVPDIGSSVDTGNDFDECMTCFAIVALNVK
jgi:hypothetical protein